MSYFAIAVAAFAVLVAIRAAIRYHARAKCRTHVAVAKEVLGDASRAVAEGRDALDRMTDATALRTAHGFPYADLGVRDEAEFDDLFARAIAAASGSFRPPAERILEDVSPAPAIPDEQRLVTREMPVAVAVDPDDEPTLRIIPPVPAPADASIADAFEDAPTQPDFTVPQSLLDAYAATTQEQEDAPEAPALQARDGRSSG